MQQPLAKTQESTILIVEDDVDIGKFLIEVIQQETRHHFVLASDGLQALRIAQELRPHLLILNYHLPHMDGIELYDRLHEFKGLEHVPAIMLSATLPEKEVKRRAIIGIKKPFDIVKLLDAIEGQLS